MSADETAVPDNEDLKAKMRDALERKKSNDRGVASKGHGERGQSETHGPVGGKREFRRKSG